MCQQNTCPPHDIDFFWNNFSPKLTNLFIFRDRKFNFFSIHLLYSLKTLFTIRSLGKHDPLDCKPSLQGLLVEVFYYEEHL